MKAAEATLDRAAASAVAGGVDSERALRERVATLAFHQTLRNLAHGVAQVEVLTVIATIPAPGIPGAYH